jgi:hypothetical protein
MKLKEQFEKEHPPKAEYLCHDYLAEIVECVKKTNPDDCSFKGHYKTCPEYKKVEYDNTYEYSEWLETKLFKAVDALKIYQGLGRNREIADNVLKELEGNQ